MHFLHISTLTTKKPIFFCIYYWKMLCNTEKPFYWTGSKHTDADVTSITFCIVMLILITITAHVIQSQPYTLCYTLHTRTSSSYSRQTNRHHSTAVRRNITLVLHFITKLAKAVLQQKPTHHVYFERQVRSSWVKPSSVLEKG